MSGSQRLNDALRIAADLAPEAILVTSGGPPARGAPKVLYANPAFARMTGCPAADIVGKSLELCHGRGAAPDILEPLRAALDERRADGVELVADRKDATPCRAEMTIVPVPGGRRGSDCLLWIQRGAGRHGDDGHTPASGDGLTDYHKIFDQSPISIWVEDWSAVKPVIERLREQGVGDFARYLRENGELARELAFRTEVLDFNATTVELYRAPSKEAFWPIALDDFRTPDEFEAYCDTLAAFAEGKTKCVVEGWEKTFDGDDIFLRDTAFIAAESAEDWSRVIHAVADVTDQKRAEDALARVLEKLRESEAKFRSLVSNVPGAIYRCRQWKTVYVSDVIEDITGYPARDFIGDRRSFISMAHPEDMAALAETVKGCLARRQPFALEYRIRHADGGLRWVYTRGQGAFAENGEIEWVDGVIFDVTDKKVIEEELRESEERFRSMVANIPGAIYRCTFDEDWTDEYISAAIEDIAGYPASDFIRNRSRTYASLIHSDDVDKVREAVKEAVAQKEPYVLEYRLYHANGTIRWVQEKGQASFDEAGNVRWLDGAIFDITERKATEEQLHQAQKIEALGQLTGGVAHDFNNLLTVISGNIELAQLRLGHEAKLASWLQAASEAARRGADLVQRLAVFSRRQTLQPRVIDLNELVAELIEVFRRTLGETTEIETTLTEESCTTRVDPNQLEGALLNLALNARDAMAGGGKLIISTANVFLDDDYAASRAEVRPGEYVMLTVADTGTGIPEAQLNRVFEPFFTTKEVGKGTGLGLSMVYGFVKQSGGHVAIYSEEGHGTTVKLYLPVADESCRPADRKMLSEEPRSRGEAVLVVEDDPDVRKLVASLLRDLDYWVLESENGHAALGTLESSRRVDLVLVDVVLPGGMSGPELAADVRHRYPDVRVLFMSGFAEDAIGHQGGLSQGVELLNKPFRKSELAHKVRTVLEK